MRTAWIMASALMGVVSPVDGQDHVVSAADLKQRGIVTVGDALAALQARSARNPGVPVPIGNPGEWFGPDAYPAAAIRAGAQGRVVASIAVDKAGRVAGCTVEQSSGSPDLDATTCAIATRRMTFVPAHDAQGHAIAGHYILPVRWQLPAGGVTNVSIATTLVSIGPDGAVLSCTPVNPAPLTDICGAFPTGRKLDLPASMRGRVFAIGTIVRPLAE